MNEEAAPLETFGWRRERCREYFSDNDPRTDIAVDSAVALTRRAEWSPQKANGLKAHSQFGFENERSGQTKAWC